MLSSLILCTKGSHMLTFIPLAACRIWPMKFIASRSTLDGTIATHLLNLPWTRRSLTEMEFFSYYDFSMYSFLETHLSHFGSSQRSGLIHSAFLYLEMNLAQSTPWVALGLWCWPNWDWIACSSHSIHLESNFKWQKRSQIDKAET